MKRVLAFVLAAVTASAGADLKIKIVSESNDPPLPLPDPCPGQCVSVPDDPAMHEEVMYVHGNSQRVEFKGIVMGQGPQPFSDGPWTERPNGSFRANFPHMAVITHCDTGQVIELDLDAHEYREFKQPKYPTQKSFEKDVERARNNAKRRVRWNRVDTGETKEFFGFVARHEITTIAEKIVTRRQEEVVDGWYIDLPQPGCAPEYLRHGEVVMATFAGGMFSTEIMTSCNCFHQGGDWADYRTYSTLFWAEGHFIPVGLQEVTKLDYAFSDLRTSLLYVGFTPRGLAVEQTISGKWSRRASMHEAAGQGEYRPSTTSVVELSTATVDPALFEIPPGFVKVRKLYQHRSILERVSK